MKITPRAPLSLLFSVFLFSLFSLVYSPAARAQAQSPQLSARPAPPAAREAAASPDLATAPTAELMKIYGQLRDLQGSSQVAITENVVFHRDAATFTFKDGELTLAAPVAGRIVAAVFRGDATFELDPPTAIEQHQIARFAGQPKLVDTFKQAVFFFTDDSWSQLQKLVDARQRGDAQAAGNILSATQSRYEHSFNDWWANQRRGNPVMGNLAARMLADLADPSSKGIFLADIQAQHSGDLLYQISWNRPSILLPTLANDEGVMLLHYKLNDYFEWWAGFHVGAANASGAQPEAGDLIAHCAQETISADISNSNHLSATAQMQFDVPAGTPRLLPFNLAGVLRISAVTGANGQPWGFIQEARNLDSGPWLILPAPATAGQSYTAKIGYTEDSTGDSRVITKMGNGLFFVGERTSWYPSFGAFDDRTNFHLHFTSPSKYQFIATGRQVDSKKSGNELVSDYVSQIPFSVVGFNYGNFVEKTVSGKDLKVTDYAGKEVPDELKGLEAQMSLAQLQQGSITPKGGDVAAQQYGILVSGFNTSAGAKFAAAKSYQAFRLYETYFGSLPFHTISVTEQPVGDSGQSWPTLVFLPYVSLLDATTVNSLGLDQTPQNRDFLDVVAVHEMAHQWWGHMVGWKTYHDQWLSEGFAEFSAALYLQMYEPGEAKDFWDLSRSLLLDKDRAGNRPVDIGPIWLNDQLNARLERDVATTLIYRKGAYVLEMLRTVLQNPQSANPDAQFMRIMHDFVQTYAGKNASTEDFERIAEKDTGTDLRWFFNDWVYGTETPQYDFKYQLSNGPQGKTVLHIALTQSQVSNSFAMSVPFYVYVNGKPHMAGFIRVSGSRTVQANATLGFRPDKVAIDVDHRLLAIEKQ